MDLNSQHQIVSRWAWRVQPGAVRHRAFMDVKANVARFMRALFGSVTEMRLSQDADGWLIDVRTEGTPAHDPALQAAYREQVERFLSNGFGHGTVVTMTVKVEAGDLQDGKPRTQLVLLPSLSQPQGRMFGQ